MRTAARVRHRSSPRSGGASQTTPRARASSGRGRGRPGRARHAGGAGARLAELEEEIRLAMVEPDPNDDKNVIVEVRARRGRGGGRALRGRPLPDAHALRRAARLQDRAAVGGRRRLHVRHQGPRRLQRVQARGRHPQGPARAGDRVPGPHPHLHRHRGRAPRGGGGGRARGPERPPGGRVPLLRARAASR